MNQIARCDWLPERARWSHLARSGLPAVSRKQNFTKSHIINPLLTKFVRSRWLDIGLVLFCEFMDLDFVSVHRQAKKGLGQYPAILTSHLVNNPYIQKRLNLHSTMVTTMSNPMPKGRDISILTNATFLSTFKHSDPHSVRGRSTLKDGFVNYCIHVFRYGLFREKNRMGMI